MIYFLADRARNIYIGGSDGLALRTKGRPGFAFVAARPGTKSTGRNGSDISTDEGRLHAHFAKYKVPDYPGSDSVYGGEEIWEYIDGLLLKGLAAKSLEEAELLQPLDWGVWSPETVAKPGVLPSGQATLYGYLPASERVLNRKAAHPLHQSESNDWYTPQYIIEAARRAMGSIDTDPASSAEAQEWIQARIYYDMKTNGLDTNYPWEGNVWLNPPYGGKAPPFIERLINEYETGNVKQAILVLSANASAGDSWVEPARKDAHLVAISRRRPKFIKPGTGGREDGSPTEGKFLFYWGQRRAEFIREFEAIGFWVPNTA